MRRAECVRFDTPQLLRIELLKQAYARFMGQPDELSSRLALLAPLYGRRLVDRTYMGS